MRRSVILAGWILAGVGLLGAADAQDSTPTDSLPPPAMFPKADADEAPVKRSLRFSALSVDLDGRHAASFSRQDVVLADLGGRVSGILTKDEEDALGAEMVELVDATFFNSDRTAKKNVSVTLKNAEGEEKTFGGALAATDTAAVRALLDRIRSRLDKRGAFDTFEGRYEIDVPSSASVTTLVTRDKVVTRIKSPGIPEVRLEGTPTADELAALRRSIADLMDAPMPQAPAPGPSSRSDRVVLRWTNGGTPHGVSARLDDVPTARGIMGALSAMGDRLQRASETSRGIVKALPTGKK